jgi:metallo-beta-lactamase family protein
MFQGLRELRARNWQAPPVEPADAGRGASFSRAHIDHSGYLPRLARDGFKGRSSARRAPPTSLKIMLPDAAHLQEGEAEFRNRKEATKHSPALPCSPPPMPIGPSRS